VHNALGIKVVSNYGASAEIEGTNPDLNGGNWLYMRVGAGESAPGQEFAEFGWFKDDEALYGYIVYGSRSDPDTYAFNIGAPEDHVFDVAYEGEAADGEWDFYIDTDHVLGIIYLSRYRGRIVAWELWGLYSRYKAERLKVCSAVSVHGRSGKLSTDSSTGGASYSTAKRFCNGHGDLASGYSTSSFCLVLL
jgi:hypothetical protein